MEYKNVASQILEKIGGESNVEQASHCMTRLRLRLVDNSKIDREGIKKIKGVVGLAESNGQYQVIIGADVENVYKAFMALGTFGRVEKSTSEPKKKEKLTVKKVLGKGIEFTAGCVSPVLPVIIAAGLIQAVISVLTTFLGVDAEGNTIQFLNGIGSAGFYFLPIMIGFSGAKRVGCNPYMGAFLGSILVLPSISELVSAGGMSVFGIPIYAASYSSTVFPMVLSIVSLKLGEWIGDKICPKFIKTMGKPLISILISAPLTMCLLAPMGAILGNVISAFVQWLSNGPAFLMLGIIGVLNPFIVVTGMNVGLIPIAINNISTLGYDIVLTVSGLGSNIAAGGAAIGVASKTKNSELREMALTTGTTALFGITEPVTYAVNLPLKKPLIAQAIGGGIAGIYAGLVGLKCYGICAPGICALPLYFSGGTSNVVNFFITGVIAFVVAFISARLLGWEEPESDEAATLDSINLQNCIASPITGTVKHVSECQDKVFSEKTLGDGVVIEPKEGKVFSPCDGVISNFFETKHAIGITADNGAEVLIHVGMDTVTLNGEGFKAHAATGDRVKGGQLLLEFDMNLIQSKGLSVCTPVVVVNAEDYPDFRIHTGNVKQGESLITLHTEA